MTYDLQRFDNTDFRLGARKAAGAAQVFFAEVRVPVASRLGDEGDG